MGIVTVDFSILQVFFSNFLNWQDVVNLKLFEKKSKKVLISFFNFVEILLVAL